jgi:hypothetical protein
LIIIEIPLRARYLSVTYGEETWIKTYVDRNGLSEEIGQMFKTRNNVIREK